jgi:predicted secreted hydrolase
MKSSRFRLIVFFTLVLFTACAPATPSATVQLPEFTNVQALPGFTQVDGTRPLIFPQDLGAHEDFSTEWWYYTGNLETNEGRHFGFELTVFRVGLVPPTVEMPKDSKWYGRSLYFAHFAVSDVGGDRFYAFERYSRPGPGLAGAQASPYQVWLEDWSIAETSTDVYRLQAEQEGVALDLTLTDEMGLVLHGQNGYTRGGEGATNAAYYYSQPRLRADGIVKVNGVSYSVNGLAWKDHEFSSGSLDTNQVGWDWFSLQFEDGTALMLYQLRQRDGNVSSSSSGTFISSDGRPQTIGKSDFQITVLDTWRSPHTQGTYPARWNVRLKQPDCVLEIQPWMKDQELHFPAVTYWEGAVHFEGTCDGQPKRGNGYVELTGYAGNLPLP